MNVGFQIMEYQEWRENNNKCNPGVEEMLTGILDYIESWEGFKTRTDPIQLCRKLQEIKVKYIVHTQIEEDICVQS